jgi:hypothetical protein
LLSKTNQQQKPTSFDGGEAGVSSAQEQALEPIFVAVSQRQLGRFPLDEPVSM